jgi:peptide/nickel transport system substrate-binding protein
VAGGKNDWDVTITVFGNVEFSTHVAGAFFSGDAPPNGLNLGAVNNPDAQNAWITAGRLSGQASCAALSDFQRALFTHSDILPLSTAPVHVLFAGGTSAVVIRGFAMPATIRLAK